MFADVLTKMWQLIIGVNLSNFSLFLDFVDISATFLFATECHHNEEFAIESSM